MTADLNASISSASSAPATACDRIVSRDTTSNSSPVMNVAKRSTVPPFALTHFEWVPGMQTTASSAASTPRAPSNWVSSPRMTSGALGSRCAIPGRIRMSRSCPGTGTACSRIDASRAGVSTYPASTHPCRAPAMPQTITGSPGAAPTASRCDCSTVAKPSLPAAIMPSWLRRSPRTLPARSTSQSRKLLVPQSTATYAASLISTPSQCYPRLGDMVSRRSAGGAYARFAIDLRKRNQHDPKSCGPRCLHAAWLRQRAHVRNNAA